MADRVVFKPIITLGGVRVDSIFARASKTVEELLAHYREIDNTDWERKVAPFRKPHVAKAFAEAVRFRDDCRRVEVTEGATHVIWEQKQKRGA